AVPRAVAHAGRRAEPQARGATAVSRRRAGRLRIRGLLLARVQEVLRHGTRDLAASEHRRLTAARRSAAGAQHHTLSKTRRAAGISYSSRQTRGLLIKSHLFEAEVTGNMALPIRFQEERVRRCRTVSATGRVSSC